MGEDVCMYVIFNATIIKANIDTLETEVIFRSASQHGVSSYCSFRLPLCLYLLLTVSEWGRWYFFYSRIILFLWSILLFYGDYIIFEVLYVQYSDDVSFLDPRHSFVFFFDRLSVVCLLFWVSHHTNSSTSSRSEDNYCKAQYVCIVKTYLVAILLLVIIPSI